MDHQTRTFLDLTGTTDLVELVADRRAAWLWSSDGGRVLWANAAGAAFFSADSVSALANLNSLERSPARPHIARIAASGFEDRFSIDRLRFYRGLRVMLLTCQCKKVVLEDGSAAALIICADKGFSTTKDPVMTFAQLVSNSDVTVFVTDRGLVSANYGSLTGTPEDIAPLDGHNAVFGPIELDGALHDGALFQLSEDQKLIALNNERIETPEVEGPEVDAAPLDISSDEVDVTTDPAGSVWARADVLEEAAEALPSKAAADPEDKTAEIQDNLEIATDAAAEGPDSEAEAVQPPADGDDQAQEPADTADEAALIDSAPALGAPEHLDASSNAPENGPAADEEEPEFVFQPGRRPVRFAWKMDISQRFTFLSDEFANVVGPASADIVGLTWAEVANRFDLDPRGSIARALDRRDTWSGKTVDWPVTDAALRVPVDMAALPAFDRNRTFEGYRGFGVCRAADAKPGARIAALSPAMAAFDEHLDDGQSEADEEDAHASNETEPVDDHHEVVDEHSVEESEVSEIEAPPVPAAEDLKPKQPDALAGKMAIGASAAALVGSLSRFSDGSAQTSSEPHTPAMAEEAVDQSASLSDEPLSDEQTTIDDTAEEPNSPLEAAMKMDAALQQGVSGNDLDLETPEIDSDIEKVADDDGANSPSEAVKAKSAAAQEPEIADLRKPEAAEAIQHVVPGSVSDEAPEPAGISGPAPLDASEIETAVRSLQKSFKKERQPAAEQDLFAEAETEVPATDRDVNEDTAAETVDAGSDNLEEAVDEVANVEVAAEDDEADEANFDAGLLSTDLEENEEREFFEETAAFEAEELAAEFEEDLKATDTADILKPGPSSDNVIPLATVNPRVVPVDTTGLSRPERQAFRKIAEALGARLEGDLEGWDEPDADETDNREEDLPDLPPEVPEAGPIDPSLLDRLPIGIAIAHDRDVLYANKALLSILGYGAISELTEAGGLEALFIDEAEDLPDADGMVGELDETMKVRLADGGVRSVDAHMHSVPWNGSRGLMISITERFNKPAPAASEGAAPNFFKEVRSELDGARTQISEMETILETATDGVLVLDERGTILKVNGSAEALFSASRGEMIGSPFIEFLAPESHRSAEDYLDGLARNGVASILNDGREVLGKVPTGGLIPLFMTMGRIGDKDDTKFCVVLRDITQWKTAEEELTQAKRQAENASSQKSDFLAKISHEIRTPLNAIIGFSEVMMEERFGPIGNDRYKDYLKDIRTSGSHIMSLINDLLDLSKIEAGKQDLKFSAVSANDIINECVALMQPQANRERVIIRASLPDAVPNIVADPRSLRQIVLNLLSNGIKYNKSGGQVILSTTLEPNGEVSIRVRDTGSGMNPKQLAAALEPFRQVHTARRGGGTGLGLPLTKALAEANRAQFHIDSTPDQGTLVEITFPTERVLSE
ncbi:ATP-binding protein [Roseibium alexandrii]|uniref:PAS domain-containing sensor histidine kinase n=1 Tax=Roseibium alexandrii TaxID=388408 RepID=UPI00375360EE